MSNNVPLTIENFDFEKLRAKAFESKKSGDFTYFAIPFDYDGGDPLIKIKGNFGVFKHVNAGRETTRWPSALTMKTKNSLVNWNAK